MGVEDILAAASSAALPQQGGVPNSGSGATFGPQPLQMPQPLPRFQPPELSYGKAGNEFQTVGGRKRADKEALFHSVAQLIKAGGDYVQARKNRALEADITRLIGAQQGLQEAQNVLKQNPNDETAKKAVATNTAIINDITSDPKKSKQLQKAFNIDIFGGGKNKQENAALASAMTKWKQEQNKPGAQPSLNPIAQRFQQQQPQRMQMDPQLAMQAQMIKAGLIPNAGQILKANSEAAKLIQEAKNTEERVAGQEKAAQTLADARKYGADKIVDAANVRALGQQQAAMIRFRADTLRAKAMLEGIDKRMAAMERIAGSKQGDKTIGNMVKEGNILKGRAADLAKKRKDIEDQLTKYAESSGVWGSIKGAVGVGKKSTMTAAEASQLQKDLFTLKLEQQSVEGQWKDLQMRTDTYVKMGSMPDPSLTEDKNEDGIIEVSPEDMNSN